MAEDNKRLFTVQLQSGKEVKLSTRVATQEELNDAEFEYSKAFNHAIMNGIMPQSRMLSELLKNGIWSEERDEAIEEQRQKVIKLEDLMDDEETDKERVAEELKEARTLLYEMRQEKTDLLSHTAEAKADEAQRSFIVSRVTEDAKSGIRVWKKFNDYVTEEDANLVFRATYEYLTFVNNLPSDFMDQLPENQVASKEEAPAEGEAEEASEEEKTEVKLEVVEKDAPKEEAPAEAPAEVPAEAPAEAPAE